MPDAESSGAYDDKYTRLDADHPGKPPSFNRELHRSEEGEDKCVFFGLVILSANRVMQKAVIFV